MHLALRSSWQVHSSLTVSASTSALRVVSLVALLVGLLATIFAGPSPARAQTPGSEVPPSPYEPSPYTLEGDSPDPDTDSAPPPTGEDPAFADPEFDAMLDGEGISTVAAPSAPAITIPAAPPPTTRVIREEAPAERFADPEARRRWMLSNTYLGATGGVYLPDARAAVPGTFRLQLGFEFFYRDGFLAVGDEASHVGGALALSVGVHDLVELHASVHAYANSNLGEFPTVLMSLGDSQLGVKVGGRVRPGLSLGADLTIDLPTSADLVPSLDATGGSLSALLTYDLREREQPIPLIFRARLGYTLDNSANLVDDVESYRYSLLEAPRPLGDESRHFVTRFEQYALDVNRSDFVELGVSLAGDFEYERWGFTPIVELGWRLPVNRTGFDCPRPLASDEVNQADACLADQGVSAFPLTLSMMFRLRTPIEELEGFLGVDVGLTGRSRDQVTRELAANDPWMLLLGLQWRYDARPPAPPVIVREITIEQPVAPELAPRGRIVGRVVARLDDGTMTQVETPTVTYLDREASAQRPREDGRFVSPYFPPGGVTMRVTAPGHDSGDCRAEIPPAGGEVDTLCELIRLPEQQLVVVEDEQVIILEQIQFAFDSAQILPESFSLMAQIAATIGENPQLRLIEIQGHTDDQGDDEYNLDLSRRRGIAVRTWLVEHGVQPERLRSRGFGESRPLVPETTDEARAVNRRVEFRILERVE